MNTDITHVLTFVLPKANKAQMDQLTSSFQGADYEILAENKAVDLFIPAGMVEAVKDGTSAFLEMTEIKADFCIQPIKGRKKTLLICDMDSTLIGQECIVELADYAGVKDKVHDITERAMRGEIDFDGALKERVACLKDLPLSVLQDCFDTRITLNTGARTLCQTMKAHGAKTVIVSGGFTFFTQRVAEAAGFEHHHANTLIEAEDSLTGTVGMPILGREAKKERLDEYSADLGGPLNAVAIGDGANDLAMIQASGLGIAYYAKPAVVEAAHCGITCTDLTTALYYQGFKDNEFVQ